METGERVDSLVQLYGSLTNSGRGSVIFLSGPLASGKTTVLYGFGMECVKRGALVLTAIAAQEEQHIRFGVVIQLLHGTAFAEGDTRARLLALVADQAPAGGADTARRETPGHRDARAAHELGTAILALAAERPVVICVDDVPHVDSHSLRFLAYLARRSHSARLHLALTTNDAACPDAQWFVTELSRRPHFHRMVLSPLDSDGVAQVLVPHVGAAAARRLATAFHDITGGNRLLLDALISDSVAATSPGELRGPTAGSAFEAAVLTCLHRCGTMMSDVIRAVAVLGNTHSVELIDALVGHPTEEVVRTLDALRQAGLLNAHGFRHPATHRAVLHALPPAERGQIRRRAAQWLHEQGGDITAIADHLTVMSGAAEPWGIAVLRQAADLALDDHHPELAARYLEAARRFSADGAQRAALTAKLASVEWRFNPLTAMRHLPKLLSAQEQGSLSHEDTATMIRYLLWHGRILEATAALARLVDSVGERDVVDAAELDLFRLWLTYFYPSLLDRVPGARTALRREVSPASFAAAPQLQAVTLLNIVLDGDACPEVTATAEHLLRTCRLSDATLEPIMTAIVALICVDRLDIAATRVDRLLGEAMALRAGAWHAELSAIRAVVALRSGDLRHVISCARTALSRLDIRMWGTKIGSPLGSLVLAHTALGQHQAAEALLRLPVPEQMYDSTFGLSYLHARGHHYLATGRIAAAQCDFEACGELMTRWHIDLPGLVAWRTDLAQLHLRRGDLATARRLAEEQLARLPAGRSRSGGIALRLLAATSGQTAKLALLKESAEVLEACGASAELAHALRDLSQAHQELGELDQARVVERRATHLAKRCGFELARVVYPQRPPAHPTGPAGRMSTVAGALSDAELRVAQLAAKGLTNREIAHRLYVTISTVEQHLTKVYRKLKVNRREDLSSELPAVVGPAH